MMNPLRQNFSLSLIPGPRPQSNRVGADQTPFCQRSWAKGAGKKGTPPAQPEPRPRPPAGPEQARESPRPWRSVVSPKGTLVPRRSHRLHSPATASGCERRRQHRSDRVHIFSVTTDPENHMRQPRQRRQPCGLPARNSAKASNCEKQHVVIACPMDEQKRPPQPHAA